MAESQVSRFLGGSPLSVLVKLIFLSILVGAGMAFLGVTPHAVFDSIVGFVRDLVQSGFGMVGDLGRWLIYGAAVVVPIWLILRVLDSRR